jgi:hypothetical protein
MVSIPRSTPSHTPLTGRCHFKMMNWIRPTYLRGYKGSFTLGLQIKKLETRAILTVKSKILGLKKFTLKSKSKSWGNETSPISLHFPSKSRGLSLKEFLVLVLETDLKLRAMSSTKARSIEGSQFGPEVFLEYPNIKATQGRTQDSGMGREVDGWRRDR